MKWFPITLWLMLLAVYSLKPVNAGEPEVTPKAYVAKIPAGMLDSVSEVIASANAMANKGRMGFYLRKIEDESYLFHYVESDQSDFQNEVLTQLSDFIEPMPIAAQNDRLFEPMESVFFFKGAADKEPEQPVTRIAMITGLKHDKEMHYRLLHANPWPDVLAAITRANLRNFSIFLEEINGKLYLFGWLEYVGKDSEADSTINKKDPASIRWWKETDACQIAPKDSGEGMWGGLEELHFIGE